MQDLMLLKASPEPEQEKQKYPKKEMDIFVERYLCQLT